MIIAINIIFYSFNDILFHFSNLDLVSFENKVIQAWWYKDFSSSIAIMHYILSY